MSVSACYSGRQDYDDNFDPDEPTADSGGVEGGAADTAPPESDAELAGMRRLSIREYNRAVEMILGDATQPANAWSADAENTGYDTDLANANVSAQNISQFHATATDVAERFVPRWRDFVDCGAEQIDERACAETLIEQVGRRLFRRPLLDDEHASFVALLDEFPGDEGVGMVISAMLQSIPFLYLTTIGREDDPSRLSEFELASRLSFFLTGGPPDDELLDAAEAGRLSDDLRAEAERLLFSEAGERSLIAFYRQWIGLSGFPSKSADVFPEFTPEVEDDLLEGFDRLVSHLVLDPKFPGTFASLLTEPVAVVSPRTAALVGVEPPDEGFEVVELDPSRRAGLLTDPAIMASFATNNGSHPIVRGVRVLDKILCASPPPPDEEAEEAIEEAGDPPAPGDEGTTREFVEVLTGRDECIGCHRSINGVGFAFEHYTGDGSWRDEENGKPVNATGLIPALGGQAAQEVDGAVELAHALASREEAAMCFSRHYFRFVFGREEQDVDEASLEKWTQTLMSDEEGSMREFLVGIVTSPNFLSRNENLSGQCD